MKDLIFKDLTRETKPFYKAIANCIEHAIHTKELKNGEKLLTHRALAERLATSPVTIRQSYQELEKLGLLQSEVGRGTFVTSGPTMNDAIANDGDTDVNLSIIKPIETKFLPIFKDLLLKTASSDLESLCGYGNQKTSEEHILLAKQWVNRRKINTDQHSVVICSGAQHALLISILAATKANDFVAVEEYCYPGIVAALRYLQRNPVRIPLNKNGMNPKALEQVCEKYSISAVIVVASCQNPTASVMPNSQRKELASVAEKYNLTIIDDDIYGFLTYPECNPLWTFAPTRTLYIDSLSKSISPTLRIAFLVVPQYREAEFNNLVRASVWLSSPLLKEVAFNLIKSDKASEIERWQKNEIIQRQKLASVIFQESIYMGSVNSPIIWLSLPSHWNSATFAKALRKIGIRVTEDFYFSEEGTSSVSKVRISLMGTKSLEELESALLKIKSTMEDKTPMLLY